MGLDGLLGEDDAASLAYTLFCCLEELAQPHQARAVIIRLRQPLLESGASLLEMKMSREMITRWYGFCRDGAPRCWLREETVWVWPDECGRGNGAASVS